VSPAAAAKERSGLGAQIAFTVVALALALGAYVLAGYGKRGQLPATFGAYAATFVGGYVGALVVVRRFAPRADPALFPVAGVLVGLGFAMIFRLSGGLAAEQATWILVGLLAFAATLMVVRDARMLDAFTYTIGLAGLVLLLLPTLPGIGRTINGARLWVQVGPIGFQPAEIGKVLVVIFPGSRPRAWDRCAFPPPSTSVRSCSRGGPRSPSCSCSATSVPRSCTSASSWSCSGSRPVASCTC
jgi:hypothetical protein